MSQRTVQILTRVSVLMCIVTVAVFVELWWHVIAAHGLTWQNIASMIAMVGGLALSWYRTFDVLREHQR